MRQVVSEIWKTNRLVTILETSILEIDPPWEWVAKEILHVKLVQICLTETRWTEVQTGFRRDILKPNQEIKRKVVIMVVIQESLNLPNLEVKTWWNYLETMIYSTIKLLCNPLKTARLVDTNNNLILVIMEIINMVVVLLKTWEASVQNTIIKKRKVLLTFWERQHSLDWTVVQAYTIFIWDKCSWIMIIKITSGTSTVVLITLHSLQKWPKITYLKS